LHHSSLGKVPAKSSARGPRESKRNPKVDYNKILRGKGKEIPLQAWTGPEGSRRLRLPDFKTIGTWR